MGADPGPAGPGRHTDTEAQMSQPDPGPVVLAVGDQPADAAMSFAVSEAQRLGCGLHVVHVVHSLPQGPELVLVQSVDVEAVGRQSLRDTLERCRELAGEGTRVTGRLMIGTVVHELVAAVEDLDEPRVVVLQHRDLSRVRRLVSRSTTRGLAARLRVPLVSVPAGWTGPPQTPGGAVVTAGVDSPERSDAVLVAAVGAARAHGARLELLHSWGLPGFYDDPALARTHGEGVGRQEAQEIRERLDTLAGEGALDLDGVEVSVEAYEEPTAERLVDASRTSCLLVLGKHDPLVPMGSHLGPVTGAVLHEAACPVLLVEPHRRG